MEQLDPLIRKDVERIQQLPIVPSILELICRTTGMGFAAVARVTEDKWIACAVKDEIQFGLKPGGELVLGTTICDEIRGHGQPVVIDEVSSDPQYCQHHTPRQYGFQSYISIPIMLKDGSFFGTLCAIDPRPFALKSSKMVTLFTLFADLIAYHLLTLEEIEAKNEMLAGQERQLRHSADELNQYAHISRHTLREPLRKLRLFTDKMIHLDYGGEDLEAKRLALKVNSLATDFTDMIARLTEFSELTRDVGAFEPVDLNELLETVLVRLQPAIDAKKAVVHRQLLPTLNVIREQLYEVFYQLLSNSLNFTRIGVQPVIRVYADLPAAEEIDHFPDVNPSRNYVRIVFEDNGTGIDSGQYEKIFDLFRRLDTGAESKGIGMGLSQAKKIVLNHQGVMTASSEPGTGARFIVILPLS